MKNVLTAIALVGAGAIGIIGVVSAILIITGKTVMVYDMGLDSD